MNDGLHDVADRIWPILLFLILIQIMANLYDNANLFNVSTHITARITENNRIALFLLFTALATVSTWMLSIDTTAMLLTPISLTMAAELGLSTLPFAFTAIQLANSTSLLLPVSNLTNLLTQERLRLGPTGFVHKTWVPQLAVLVIVIAMLLVRHHRELRGSYPIPDRLPAYDRILLWLAILVVVLIKPAILLSLAAWLVALSASITLIANFVVRRPQIVRPSRLPRLVP